VKKPAWSRAEDDLLRQLVDEHGTQWQPVYHAFNEAALGPHRTIDTLRVRFNRLVHTGEASEPKRGLRPGAAAWTPEEDAALLAHLAAGLEVTVIARRMKRSAPSIAHRIGALRVAHPIAAIRAGWQPGEEDSPAAAWDAAKRKTARSIQKHAQQHDAHATIPTDRPIAIAVISDQHIRESGPVELERMEADARLVATTDGMYAILGGDGVDNHIKHHSAMVHGGSSPSQEWMLYEHYLGMFDGKLLAMISGNHDDWTSDMAGPSWVKRLAEDKRLFFAHDEVRLTVDVGGHEYRLLVRHQFRMESAFNQGHAVQRLWEMGSWPFDIGVLCHKHVPYIGTFVKHNLERWAARPGSYQFTSGYARRYGFGTSAPTCPTFVLWPAQRRIVGFLDVREASEYLTLLRGRAA
jgi:hypothetical protein